MWSEPIFLSGSLAVFTQGFFRLIASRFSKDIFVLYNVVFLLISIFQKLGASEKDTKSNYLCI